MLSKTVIGETWTRRTASAQVIASLAPTSAPPDCHINPHQKGRELTTPSCFYVWHLFAINRITLLVAIMTGAPPLTGIRVIEFAGLAPGLASAFVRASNLC